MPKRKTADAKIEKAVPAAEPKKRSTSLAKTRRSASSSATHKLTTTKKAEQPSHVTPSLNAPVAPEVTKSKAFAAPTHAETARLAYSYFERRGFHAGNPHEDWIRAERELMELAQNS